MRRKVDRRAGPERGGPVRVLHTVASLHVGGINRLLLTNVEGLKKEGIHSEVAYCYPPTDLAGSLRELGVEPHALGHRGLSGTPTTLVRLVRLIRRLDVDAIHCHYLIDRFLGCLAGRLTGTPVMTTLHDTARKEQTDRSWRVEAELALTDRLLRSTVASSIAVSRAVKRVYVKEHGLRPDRVTVLYSGVDTDVFHPREDRDRVSLIRRELGVANRRPLLVNVARLQPMKGQRYLPAMMAKLRSRWPNAHLLVAGDGELRDELVQMTTTEGVEDCITWLGSRSDVPDLLEVADLFVFPSVGEGLGIALLEAMAAGKPIVATDLPALREVVSVGVNGRLVPPRDPAALAEAVTRICSSEGQLERFGRASARIAEERFSSRRTARELADIYRSVAA